MVEIKCLHCGQCCYFFDENFNKIPCKYLRIKGNKTRCAIYHRRLGTLIYRFPNGIVGICRERKDTLYDYPNCPYNTNKPFSPEFIESKQKPL